MAKLKVFRTPIGFHDAYVAAPSQKAALEAWGADTNLFAAGIAERVTDPALSKEPLARPGEVIRRPRGSADEHVRALGQTPKPRPRKAAANDSGEEGNRPSPRPSPAGGRGRSGTPSSAVGRGRKPSRADVDEAEAALAEAEDAHRAALEAIRAEQEALDRRRRALEQDYRGEWDRLSARLEKKRDEYRRKMADWSR